MRAFRYYKELAGRLGFHNYWKTFQALLFFLSFDYRRSSRLSLSLLSHTHAYTLRDVCECLYPRINFSRLCAMAKVQRKFVDFFARARVFFFPPAAESAQK